MLEKHDDRYSEGFIKGINVITGIPYKKLYKYASENNPLNILEHPETIGPNEQQSQKISLLNEFFKIYKLLKMQEEQNRIVLNTSARSGEYFTSIMGGTKDREKFVAAFLDTGNNIIETRTLAEGSINEAVVYPRDIMKAALNCDCKSVILAHNHSGGSLTASRKDLELTEKMVSIFRPLEIKVLDHIIVAGARYVSMVEQGWMPESVSRANYEPVVLNNHDAVEERVEFDIGRIETVQGEMEEDEWER